MCAGYRQILHHFNKGLEHLQILVFKVGAETNLSWIEEG